MDLCMRAMELLACTNNILKQPQAKGQSARRPKMQLAPQARAAALRRHRLAKSRKTRRSDTLPSPTGRRVDLAKTL